MSRTLRIAEYRKPSEAHKRSGERGFSLLEIVVAAAILMVVGSMALVNGARLVQSIRLSQSATSYANLLQQARIRAVRDGSFHSVLTTTGTQPTAFIDIGGSGAYVSGDPQMVFSQGVNPMALSSGPGLTNLKAQFLPANGQHAVNTSAAGPTFGPRGLPCSPSSGTCPSLASPTAYITLFQNSVTSKWAAVTVTPAARIQVWNYDGSTWNLAN